MKFKAILFDFDGLMFDTEKLWKYYNQQANKLFNVDFSEEDRIKIAGANEVEIRKIIKKLYTNLDVDTYRDWIRGKVHFHQKNKEVELKKGLIELLEYAKHNNILSAIVSGSESVIIKNLLSKSNINHNNFKAIITGDMKVNPKPSPDVYLLACKELMIKPSEAIVLEDSYNGVRAGKKAGCFTIMIPDTFPPNDEMKQTADLILNDLNEVIEFLKN